MIHTVTAASSTGFSMIEERGARARTGRASENWLHFSRGATGDEAAVTVYPELIISRSLMLI